MTGFKYFLIFACSVVSSEGSRILAVFPTPSLSHQLAFRPLITELVKRGHELVVMTTDPIYNNGEAPANLTEIDVHDISYEIWRREILSTTVTSGNKNDIKDQLSVILNVMVKVLEELMQVNEVQNMLMDTNQKFDLLLLEAYFEPLLALTHLYKAPVIQVSSFGSFEENLHSFGMVSHPLLYPTCVHQRVYNLTLWEKLTELYQEYYTINLFNKFNKLCDRELRKIFGAETPPLKELKNNVDMLFLNIHSIWERNRPVPPNVIFMGGVHQKPEKEVSKELKAYLDSSQNGVIYISFGTNIDPSLLPQEKIQAIINAVAKSPYDVIWKWNQDEMPGRTPNIKISKWWPQSDLLRHPKVKIFITQGGLQSTDEAITAGVPLIGLPMFGDQWFNVEQYVYHKIGIQIDMETITEEKLSNAIQTILKDDSYRQNVVLLRTLMHDQPQSPLERAVWWTEYVIRHSGARHLRAAGANKSIFEYYELELVTYFVLSLLCVITLAFIALNYFCKLVFKQALRIKVKSS
ncbi:hypothetical protein ABMA27_009814 [Loxostege sticticalis]|uniref:Glucuronosyltransferase n=1 Tax=Loxostege sticticalis TaxID=481309 RepID=A0ABR3H6L2_LOXSC